MNVDKSQRRIRRMFGEISPRYDFLNHFLSGGTDYYWRWKAVRSTPMNEEAPILDVCTGTGDLAIAYWKQSRGRVRVFGTDFTHKMLQLAKTKLSKKCGRSNQGESLKFLEADTQQLPFADNQFQVVSVAFGLRNVTDTERGLQEMVRVCKPGGRVLVLEFSMPGNPIVCSLYRCYMRHVLPRIGQLFSGSRQAAYHYLPESVSEFPSGEALAEVMRTCGLQPVTWKPLTFGVATLYCGVK